MKQPTDGGGTNGGRRRGTTSGAGQTERARRGEEPTTRTRKSGGGPEGGDNGGKSSASRTTTKMAATTTATGARAGETTTATTRAFGNSALQSLPRVTGLDQILPAMTALADLRRYLPHRRHRRCVVATESKAAVVPSLQAVPTAANAPSGLTERTEAAARTDTQTRPSARLATDTARKIAAAPRPRGKNASSMRSLPKSRTRSSGRSRNVLPSGEMRAYRCVRAKGTAD